MATLSEHQTTPGVTTLSRGQVTRQQGATTPVPSAAPKPDLGAIGVAVDKVSKVTRQTLGFAGSIGGAVGKFAINTPKYVYQDLEPFLRGVARTATGDLTHDLHNNKVQQDQLDSMMQGVVNDYKSGKISKDNYAKRMRDIGLSYQDLGKDAQTIQGKTDRGKIATSAAMTAADILTAGSLKLEQVAGKQAIQAGSKEALRAVVDVAATDLERTVLKAPVIRDLVMRNLGQEAKILAGETTEKYLLRESRAVAVNYLMKRPIFYQSNIGQATSLYKNILEGDFKGALTDSAWLGMQTISGGPLGAISKLTTWGKSGVSKLAYGKGSLMDAVSMRIGDGNSSQLARFVTTVQKKAPGEEVEKNFRIWQEGYLRAAGGDVNRAADNVVAYFESQGVNADNLTASDIYKSYKNHRSADELLHSLAEKGVIPGVTKEEALRMTPVRMDSAVRDNLANAFKGVAPELQARLDKLNELAASNPAWSQNELFMDHLQQILSKEQTGKDIARAIQSIDAASLTPNLPKKIAKQFADLGYTIAMPKTNRQPYLELDDTRKLITGAIKGNTEVFDAATSAQPQLASIAGWLEKAGISPKASNEMAGRKLAENVVASLDNLGVGGSLGLKDTQGGDMTRGGQAILYKLQSFMDNMAPSKAGNLLIGGRAESSALTDIRQLTIGHIQEALGHMENGRLVKAEKDVAKAVSKAIMQGYRDVPLEFRGLGDAVVDRLYALNPAQKYYSRIQSALRYTYNPFFQLQERAETKILSHAQASNLVWMKPAEFPGTQRQWLDQGVETLNRSGFFDSSLAGEAAQDQILGRITANITKGQQRDLAGLAYDMAKTRGISLEQMVNQHSNEVEDALRVVVQYGRHGVLASPLARTMNLAFFPVRYNLKVTQLAAQTLAKEPPAVQKAVLHSMFSMKDWLGSDEGIAWQSKHADAIQVFNWITPVNSIAYTFNLLGVDTPLSGSEGKDKPSWANFGILGGLPLGVITQLLDGQGIINLNKPYVDPKTGNVIPKYIPQTTKARAATALADVINSMFTYPGRILGLPGKNQAIRNAVSQVVSTSKEDFTKVPQDGRLTPMQQSWVRVVQGDTSKEAIDSLYHSPAPGQFNGYTLPPMSPPVRAPFKATAVPRRSGLPTKASKAKKAKTAKTKNYAIPIQ